ncbi:FeoA family protein [uncultured Tessaracoccus sp.]|uniref:FeoA family protein n=1 Tax=uncultured Tessaracoccus sp. TaxID=905023 RepID=UPI002602EE76|nr:FeoA family protein [uncultured Tessaracoccus sp.]
MSTKQSRERAELGELQAGTGAVVTNVVRTPGNHFVVRRLAELGIRPGAQITAGQRTPGGGRVVGVAGAHLALDRATLRMLEVRPA